MKSKTIRKVLNKKVEDWASSIEDDEIANIVRKNTIITGGSIASMLLQEPVNDYDVYFRTREATIAVAQYYLNRFKPKNASGIPVPIHLDSLLDDRVRIVVKSAGIVSEEGAEKDYNYFEGMTDGGRSASQYVTEIMHNPGEIEDTYEDLNEQAQQIEDGPKYRPVFMSTNAITLSHKIQIVIRFYGEPEEIHENYDFVHCTNYYTSWDDNLVLKADALETLLTKELRYVGSKYPLASVIRTRKFIKRGFTVNAGQYLKMIMQLNELDLKSIPVLQDQLTGVDAAYFHEVLGKLKAEDKEKVNTAYLIEIIDRLF